VSRQQLAATVVPANATPIAAPICLPWTEARNSMQLHLVHHCIGFCFFGLWDAHWSAILLMFAYVEQQALCIISYCWCPSMLCIQSIFPDAVVLDKSSNAVHRGETAQTLSAPLYTSREMLYRRSHSMHPMESAPE
jgi:hypothetical protein